MWKGHTLEVQCTNIQSKRVIKWWNNISYSLKYKWVWENFREDYSTPTSTLFVWDKRALFGNYLESLLSNSLLWNVLFHYLTNLFLWMLVQWTSILCPLHIHVSNNICGVQVHYNKFTFDFYIWYQTEFLCNRCLVMFFMHFGVSLCSPFFCIQ